MSRIIKFRAWRKGAMTYEHSFNINIAGQIYFLDETGEWQMDEDNEVTIMQFTGLPDKNGKEIWEGDIVTAAWMHHGKPGAPFRAYILYNEHIGSFRIGYDSLGGGSQDEIYFRHQVEVIGNIYENPELLKP